MQNEISKNPFNDKEIRNFLEELRRLAKERHFTRANLWNSEANAAEYHLSNTLLVISTALITVTSTDYFEWETCNERILLTFFWGSTVISLICGVIQHIRNKSFFMKAA